MNTNPKRPDQTKTACGLRRPKYEKTQTIMYPIYTVLNDARKTRVSTVTPPFTWCLRDSTSRGSSISAARFKEAFSSSSWNSRDRRSSVTSGDDDDDSAPVRPPWRKGRTVKKWGGRGVIEKGQRRQQRTTRRVVLAHTLRTHTHIGGYVCTYVRLEEYTSSQGHREMERRPGSAPTYATILSRGTPRAATKAYGYTYMRISSCPFACLTSYSGLSSAQYLLQQPENVDTL